MVEAEIMPPGCFLRWLREEAGKTLRGVARETGLSAPFWSDVEHSRHPVNPRHYALAAKALATREDVIARVQSFMPCGFCGRTGARHGG